MGEALPARREQREQRDLVLPEGRARRARARPRAAAGGLLARRAPPDAVPRSRGQRRAGGRRRGAAAELLGADAARRFFDRHVRGTEPLDLDLDVRSASAPPPPGAGVRRQGRRTREEGRASSRRRAGSASSSPRGAEARRAAVREGSPAHRAGLYAEDELVAEGGFRVDSGALWDRLCERGPGGALRLTVFRRDELVEVEVPLAPWPEDTVWLEPSRTRPPRSGPRSRRGAGRRFRSVTGPEASDSRERTRDPRDVRRYRALYQPYGSASPRSSPSAAASAAAEMARQGGGVMLLPAARREDPLERGHRVPRSGRTATTSTSPASTSRRAARCSSSSPAGEAKLVLFVRPRDREKEILDRATRRRRGREGAPRRRRGVHRRRARGAAPRAPRGRRDALVPARPRRGVGRARRARS